jgi:hypothetical protein
VPPQEQLERRLVAVLGEPTQELRVRDPFGLRSDPAEQVGQRWNGSGHDGSDFE